MGLPKTSDHTKIKIKMPNTSQEPPVSTKGQIRTLRTCSAQVVLRGNHCHHWHGDRCDDRCQRRCGVAHADLRSLLFLFILADLLSVYYQILVIYILPAMVW